MVFQLQTRRAIYNCKAKADGKQVKHKKTTALFSAILVDMHILITVYIYIYIYYMYIITYNIYTYKNLLLKV